MHATGTIEDYIITAIDRGIKELGFSDHAPIPLPQREGITMSPEQTEGYITSLLDYKEEYSNQIAIKIGFEVDYPIFDIFDKKYFDDRRMDYMIGSCHFIGEWPFDHSDHIEEYDRRDINEIYNEYFDIVLELAGSGLFDIVGHFDLVKKFGHRAEFDFNDKIEMIAAELSRQDTAVEINTSGLLKPVKEMYPSDEIIKILFNKNVPVTIGADTHSADLVDYGIETAIEKIKKIGYRKISGFNKRKRYDLNI